MAEKFVGFLNHQIYNLYEKITRFHIKIHSSSDINPVLNLFITQEWCGEKNSEVTLIILLLLSSICPQQGSTNSPTRMINLMNY
jgi:hypothetical protein